MEFKMKLQSLPFSMIESGGKSIELRLYDEKRKQITIGDTIRFSAINNPTKAILKYYTREQEEAYGVIGIRIKVLK